MRHALIAHRLTETNAALIDAGVGRWGVMSPEAALESLSPGDGALGRLDVTEAADGVGDGLWALGALESRGVVVLNDAAALLATHDKLLTARLLRRFGLRHPATVHVRPNRPFSAIRTPAVAKPRFGSGGRGVVLLRDEGEVYEHLAGLEDCGWFREQGVLLQTLVPPRGYDLRILVAHERVVGAVIRVAADGEWRTNISLGGIRQPIADPPSDAQAVAIASARAVGAALVGVDLVPDEQDRWTVIEVNGAVEFTHEYALGGDVFGDVVSALERAVHEKSSRRLATARAALL